MVSRARSQIGSRGDRSGYRPIGPSDSPTPTSGSLRAWPVSSTPRTRPHDAGPTRLGDGRGAGDGGLTSRPRADRQRHRAAALEEEFPYREVGAARRAAGERVHSKPGENDGDMSDASSHGGSAERRVVTALFADVVGSTRPSRELGSSARSAAIRTWCSTPTSSAVRVAPERGDLGEALIHTRRGLVAADEVGNIYRSLFGNFLVADQKLRLGEPEEAISHLERSSELAQYCNAGGLEALGQAWLAAARASLGDLDPAEFDAPLARAIDAGSRNGEAAVRLHRADRGCRGGAAGTLVRRLRTSGCPLHHDQRQAEPGARAHHAYGQALEAAGRTADAAAHLRTAEQLFADLGIEPDPVTA